MDVQCPKCHQTVVIRRELGESEKLVTHCPTCETAFIVKRKPKLAAPDTGGAGSTGGAGRPAPDAGPAPLPAGSTWHIRKQDGTILSFQSIRTLQTWVIAGIVSHDDQISRKGVQWKRIGALPELASFIEKTRKLHEDAGAEFTPPAPPRGAVRGALAPISEDEDAGAGLPLAGAGELSSSRPPGERGTSAAEAFAPTKTSWTQDELPMGGRPPTRARDGHGWRWAFALLLVACVAAVVVFLLLPPGSGDDPRANQPTSGTAGAGTPTAVAPAGQNQPTTASVGQEATAAAVSAPTAAQAAAARDAAAREAREAAAREAVARQLAAREAAARRAAERHAEELAAREAAERAGGDAAARDAAAREAAERAAAAREAAEREAAEREAAEREAAERQAQEAAARAAAAQHEAAERAVAAQREAAEKAAAERAAAREAAAEKAAAEKAAAEAKAAERAAARKAAAEKAAAEKADRRPRPAPAEPAVPRLSGDYDALMDEANKLFSSNPSQAAVLYERASRIQPGVVEPVAQLGWCYLELGNTPKAFQFFKKAIRLSPRYTDSYRGLAKAYDRAGYKREACEEYARYVAKVPASSGPAQQTRQRMSQLGCGE
jgi:tetratricopeptide (TPR) repeat protein